MIPAFRSRCMRATCYLRRRFFVNRAYAITPALSLNSNTRFRLPFGDPIDRLIMFHSDPQLVLLEESL